MFAAYLSFVCVEFSAADGRGSRGGLRDTRAPYYLPSHFTIKSNKCVLVFSSTNWEKAERRRSTQRYMKKKHYKNKQQFIYIFCFKERQRKQQNKHTTNTHIDTLPSRPSPTLLTLQNTSYDGHDRSVFAKRFMFHSCSVFGHEKAISLNSFTVNIKCVFMIWSFLLLLKNRFFSR